METSVELQAVVGKGGRIVVEESPFEEGQRVDLHAELRLGSGRRTAADVVASLDELALWLKAQRPNAPLLSDEALSRESIYED